jgi:trans-aconitate 2-methyltransferase
MSEWNPNQYEKYKHERSQPFFDLMDMVQPFEHGNVVDLGCGTGELTKILHDKFLPLNTIGIDSSKEMLQKSAEYQSPGLRFAQGEIQTWDPSERYDLIFSNAALQWCNDHETLFKTMASSLNPHGQMAIQMPMNHDYPTHTLAKEMSEEPRWYKLLNGKAYDKYASLLSVEEYAELLYKLGFKEQKVTLRVYGHVLESRAGVVEWVKGSMLTHFKGNLSESNYALFLKEFEQRLFEILPDEKPFFYPFKRALLWARK